MGQPLSGALSRGGSGTLDAMAMTLTVDDLGKLLHSAASSGDVAEIKRLLGAGAPVDWKSAKDVSRCIAAGQASVMPE